ncbi:hypothetical protein AXY43_04940 [Clostridium sp. MF28]|uniref:phage tail protein n=1 Tax=Clostridium TaxID=1485 RepID=UPI000CF8D539|nr:MULTISPECIES: phage tail protein [Clostridium]AVK47422.1 hypothetical protein AXY43_04940 [Clostridium sp. MF28]PSM57221.1 phage tail protein [Clostridium diolis]
MATKNIEIQDSTGNIYYPHTDASIVKFGDSNVNATLSDLVKNISNDVILTPSIDYGMNNVIKNNGKTSSVPSFTIQGKSVVNLLGKDGNCEDISKWTGNNGTLVLDSTNKIFGNNSIKLTTTTTTNTYIRKNLNILIDNTKYYCLSAYLKTTSTSNPVYIRSVLSSVKYSNTVTSNTFTKAFVKLSPTDLTGYTSLGIDIVMLNSVIGDTFNADGIMLEEITQSQYNDSTFTPSPYADSYTCLRNPYVEVRHENLVRNGNGEEGTDWWTPIDSTATITYINGKLRMTGTSAWSGVNSANISVKPNTNYYIKFNKTGGGIFINPTDNYSSLATSGSVGGIGYFNTGSLSSIRVSLSCNGTAGTYDFDSIMLVEGTTAPSSYKSCRLERTVLETKLTSDDSITYKNGEVTGQIWWKHKTLYGKDYDWQYFNDGTGGKCIIIPRSSLLGLQIRNSSDVFVKHDGTILNAKTNFVLDAYDSGDYFYYNPKDTDTGWAESINPNNDEVKAFMNGWKALTYNGAINRYTGWVSVIDNSYPSGTATTTTTSAGTSTTNIIVSDSSKFSVLDYVMIQNGTSWNWGYITAIPDSTHITIQIAISYVSGAIVVKCDNGTTNTSLLNWCKNNVAPNYEGYQIHYKLQDPETITDDNCHIHGDIPLFDVGDNYLYLDSGIVLGEIANPIVLGNVWLNDYDIRPSSYSAPSIFKNRDETIYSIYKNGIYDRNNWSDSISFSTYGKLALVTSQANFDTNAVYTVDYKILATQAPQIGTISCSYSQDINSAISNIQESLSSKQTHDSIFDQIVDLSLYETFDQVRAYDWHQTTAGLYIYIVINMFPKKVMPVVSFSNYNIIYYNGSSMISSNTIASIAYVGYKYSDRQIMIGLRITDSTAINNMKTYGFEAVVNNVVVDCRGRI